MTSRRVPSAVRRVPTGKTLCGTKEETEVRNREMMGDIIAEMTETVRRMPKQMTAYTISTDIATGETVLDVVGKGNNVRDLGDMKAEAVRVGRIAKMKARLKHKLIVKGVCVAENSVSWTGASWG